MGNMKRRSSFSEHHRRHPDNLDFQYVILDALYALGQTEDNFDWAHKPVILRMSATIVDTCYEFLKSKRKSRSVSQKSTDDFSSKGTCSLPKKTY